MQVSRTDDDLFVLPIDQLCIQFKVYVKSWVQSIPCVQRLMLHNRNTSYLTVLTFANYLCIGEYERSMDWISCGMVSMHHRAINMLEKRFVYSFLIMNFSKLNQCCFIQAINQVCLCSIRISIIVCIQRKGQRRRRLQLE